MLPSSVRLLCQPTGQLRHVGKDAGQEGFIFQRGGMAEGFNDGDNRIIISWDSSRDVVYVETQDGHGPIVKLKQDDCTGCGMREWIRFTPETILYFKILCERSVFIDNTQSVFRSLDFFVSHSVQFTHCGFNDAFDVGRSKDTHAL